MTLQNELSAFVRKSFRNQKQINLHRTHGRLTQEERERIALYANFGISPMQIAKKFACSPTTVLIYARKFRVKL